MGAISDAVKNNAKNINLQDGTIQRNTTFERGGRVDLACHGGTESARVLDVGHVDALFRLDVHTLVMCWFV